MKTRWFAILFLSVSLVLISTSGAIAQEPKPTLTPRPDKTQLPPVKMPSRGAIVPQPFQHPTFASNTRVAVSPTFGAGDVFAAVSNGMVNWYHSDGSFVKTLDTTLGGYTAGMGFDASGNLYVTNFEAGTVTKFDTSGNLLGKFGSGYSGNPESIVFDASGNMYVGSVNGDNAIRKFDSAGNPVAQFNVAIESRGSDWIDLASDQCTMFYTSEGTHIKRFDVCNNIQLTDFASGLHGPDYALRILPDGGVIVADNTDIHRLDSSGTIIKSYSVFGETSWFALNLDPDGTSFWSGDYNTGHLYRFDIATGSIMFGPVPSCGYYCLFGLAIFKEMKTSSLHLSLPFAHTSTETGLNRVYSFFDHQYPIYWDEPLTVSDSIYLYDGTMLPGTRYQCTGGKSCYSGHDGYDFAYLGDLLQKYNNQVPVLAAAEGDITGSGINCTLPYVQINHGNYQTVYRHLANDQYLRTSGHVKRGDPIGTISDRPDEPCSTGTHLHFEVYFDANNNHIFERDEKIDPYWFDPTKPDPWTQSFQDKNGVWHTGAPSVWMWEFDPMRLGNIAPGIQRYLASGNGTIYVPGNAVGKPALLALMIAPDPGSVVAGVSSVKPTVITTSTLGVDSNFRLSAVYSDGAPLTTFAAPLTLTIAYSDSELIFVNPNTLGLYQWSVSGSQWMPLNTTLNTISHQASAAIYGPGLFSLRSQPQNPPPLLFQVTPSSRTNNAQTIVTVTGANFQSTPSLNLGIAALSVNYVSPFMLTATIPASMGPGSYALTLTNPDGQRVRLPSAFFIVQNPIDLPFVTK